MSSDGLHYITCEILIHNGCRVQRQDGDTFFDRTAGRLGYPKNRHRLRATLNDDVSPGANASKKTSKVAGRV